MHTGRTPCEDEGREWSGMCTNQATPKIASKPPEVERDEMDSLFEPSEETNLANTWS